VKSDSTPPEPVNGTGPGICAKAMPLKKHTPNMNARDKALRKVLRERTSAGFSARTLDDIGEEVMSTKDRIASIKVQD
jgi:hypothetical protein